MADIIRREEYTTRAGFKSTYPVVRCACGGEVHCLDSWANDCDHCDREYNRDGSLLAPRSQWGEETGENFW
jgi:hypothetical protein